MKNNNVVVIAIIIYKYSSNTIISPSFFVGGILQLFCTIILKLEKLKKKTMKPKNAHLQPVTGGFFLYWVLLVFWAGFFYANPGSRCRFCSCPSPWFQDFRSEGANKKNFIPGSNQKKF